MNNIINGQFMTIITREKEVSDSNLSQAYADFKNQVREVINQTREYSEAFRFLSDIAEGLKFNTVDDKKNIKLEGHTSRALYFVENELKLVEERKEHPELFTNEDNELSALPKLYWNHCCPVKVFFRTQIRAELHYGFQPFVFTLWSRHLVSKKLWVKVHTFYRTAM